MRKHHNIVLYSGAHSRPSDLVRDYLRQNNFDFDEVNLDAQPQLAETIFKKAGRSELPITEIDGRIIVGYRPELFEILLLKEKDAE